MRVVIIREFVQLAHQVDGVPEECPIKVLTPDGSDQPFDERMRDRSIGDRLDLLDPENAQGARHAWQLGYQPDVGRVLPMTAGGSRPRFLPMHLSRSETTFALSARGIGHGHGTDLRPGVTR